MRKALPYIAGGIVLVGIALLLLFHKQERRFDGRITFNPTQKIPYGSYVAYRLLQEQFPRATVSTNKSAPGEWNIPEQDTSGIALLILVSYFNPTADELNSLTAFAQKGNTVFISALQMSERAQHFFRVQQEDAYSPYGIPENNNAISAKDSFTVYTDSSVFTAPRLFSYPGIAYDNVFTRYDSSFSFPLGYDNKKKENFLAIRTLKGTFYLQAAPITFTNLFLLYRNNHEYFEKMMALLPSDTRYVLWDEYFMYRKSSGEDDNGILRVLLKYENFRWAFWLSLIAVALYIFTETKRRQRLVPAYAKPANTTLEFVSTIGKLYYEKGDHKNLADKLSTYFLDFVRVRYRLSTAEINDHFAGDLARKSNLPFEEIKSITDSLIHIRTSYSISHQELMSYHRLLENFYSNV